MCDIVFVLIMAQSVPVVGKESVDGVKDPAADSGSVCSVFKPTRRFGGRKQDSEHQFAPCASQSA